MNVKERLNDHCIQGWHSRIENSSRAAFYKHVAHFKFQPYLNVCGITKFRYFLTRLRDSSHRLYIESGSVSVEDRKCNICSTLEDEYHFLLKCSLITNLRCQYIPRYFRFRPNMQKLIELVTNENTLASMYVKLLNLELIITIDIRHVCLLIQLDILNVSIH